MKPTSYLRKAALQVVLVLAALPVLIAAEMIPALPDVPQSLPHDERESFTRSRIKLVEAREALAHRAKIYNDNRLGVPEKDRPRNEWLSAEGPALEEAKTTHIQLSERFRLDMKVTLEKHLNNIATQITETLKAIKNLGLDKRAEDFEEWEKLADDARNEFEKQTLETILDLFFTGALDADKAEIGSIGRANPFSSQKWIGRLKAAHVKDERLWKCIREIGAATGKPEGARANIELLEVLEKESDLQEIAIKESADPGKIKTKAEAICAILCWGLKNPMAGAFGSDVQFMFASLYDNAARRASLANIDRLTNLTESELGRLKILSARIKELMNQRWCTTQDVEHLRQSR